MKNKIIGLIAAVSLLTTSVIIPTPLEVQAAQTVAASYNVLVGTTVHVLPRYTEATGTTYTYTSDNSSVATVDSKGNVTGVSAGTATILVKRTITNNTTMLSVTPTPRAVASASVRTVNKTATSAEVTSTATPTSTAVADWNTPTITPKVTSTVTEYTNYIEGLTDATPTPKPTVTGAVAADSGSTSKTEAVKTTSVSSYAMYTVNVIPLTINASKQTIGLGDTLKLTTNITDSVKWAVSTANEDSTSVSQGDLKQGNMFAFTPEEVGSYTITATYDSVSGDVTAKTTIEVVEKSEKQKELETKNKGKLSAYIKKNGFKFTDTSSALAVGDSILFETNLDNLNYADVEWASSDEKIATVSKGLVTGVSAGTVKITAKAADKKITKKITVDATSSFKFVKSTNEIAVGDSFRFTTNRDNDVEWSCDNTNVLSIDRGKVTAKAIGTATITAIYNDVILKKTVNVTGDATLLHVTSNQSTVNVNEKIIIETNREECMFSVDNANVAIIDPVTGVLTGKSKGTAIITITCGSEKALYTVNVVEGSSDLAFIGLKDSYSVGVGSIIQTNKSNTSFMSSNTAVATIDIRTGELKTLTEGVTVLYAFSGTEQVSQQIKVVAVNKGELLKTMTVGDVAKLVSNENNATWSSSDVNVVTVDNLTGDLKAVGPGTCMVYMYSANKITYAEVSVRKAPYTEEQQKAISDANRYIQTLLSEDGESLRIISNANADVILTYLRECRKYLDICEQLGVDVTKIQYYDLYDAGLNVYLNNAKGYNNGTLISLEEGKQNALTAINQAILAASSLNTAELSAALTSINDLITNAEKVYLITTREISMYDVYEELKIITAEGETTTEVK